MIRPRVTLSFAQTLDGRVAAVDGSSQWISSADSLHFCHSLRAASDAIMVGVGTVLRDDPRLTVRLVEGCDPVRVIVDSTLRTPPTAAVIRDGAARGTVLACTAAAPSERRTVLRELGATILTLPATPDGKVDLVALLASLAERGIASIMVEGGACLITGLLRAHLVDAVAITIAPLILGAGPAAVGDLGITTLAQAIKLGDVRWTTYGVDVVLEGEVLWSAT
ncbi:RibD family protein [Chloroflexus aggregans]|uniref:5-amino-6-(5-phosphoribosylamino)uracil reductase n=1 Tax=Chloroflexus aggregans (strain MD-66 / DSM 9485) TaxID=326427 RepID=B8G7W1_CHLAD|nr:dihydrofolate reductase family protein [Chloroflexus aggregans]ACL24140.1 5-amino-6-(5-phosphoribosylamino)uracil reductase [Chloroflexus aggregans DSM 9485]